MNLQAETPAARMAVNSLERLRLTKAAMPPKRKTNGDRSRMRLGERNTVSQRISLTAASARTPTDRDNSSNWMSRITDAITARAPAKPLTAARRR